MGSALHLFRHLVIRHSSLIRHSIFVIRHLIARPSRNRKRRGGVSEAEGTQLLCIRHFRPNSAVTSMTSVTAILTS
jgi:hypothetical protein